MRVSTRPEHAHEALGWGAGCLGELVKANRGVDVVPDNRLACLQIAHDKSLDAFGRQAFTKRGIVLGSSNYRTSKGPRQRHGLMVTLALPNQQDAA